MIKVVLSHQLMQHLSSFEEDGATVADVLFEGGRLNYPARRAVEKMMGAPDPYTLELESRVLLGFEPRANASIRFLARIATEAHRTFDPTLDLLWGAHASYVHSADEGPALDRLVAALVCIQDVRREQINDPMVDEAALRMVAAMHANGIPPTYDGLEEIFDGADPACVGLGLVLL